MSCKEDKADYVVLHLTDYGKVTYDVSIDVQGYVSPTFQKISCYLEQNFVARQSMIIELSLCSKAGKLLFPLKLFSGDKDNVKP